MPESRAEITTEGGLDVRGHRARDPPTRDGAWRRGYPRVAVHRSGAAQIEAARRAGARVIELHTGAYAEATGAARAREFERLRSAAKSAASLGFTVNAGHGLNYHNVEPIAAIAEIIELNIGHSIIARSVVDGLAKAVRDMKELMRRARAAPC